MWQSHLIKSKYSRSLKLECGWTTFCPKQEIYFLLMCAGDRFSIVPGNRCVSCTTSPRLPRTLFSEDVPQLRFWTGPISTESSSPPWAGVRAHTHSRVHKRSDAPLPSFGFLLFFRLLIFTFDELETVPFILASAWPRFFCISLTHRSLTWAHINKLVPSRALFTK